MNRKLFSSLGVAAIAAVALSTTAVFGQGKGKDITCPKDEGWVKVDSPSGSADDLNGNFVIWWGGENASGENEVCVILPACWKVEICLKSGSGKKGQVDKLTWDEFTGPGTFCLTTGSDQQISHISWRLSEVPDCEPPDEACEWCSPGYWRQEHHFDSWPEGYHQDDLYSAYFGEVPPLSKSGQNAGASTDPTLLEVLQYPQYYGGAAFNAVATLLSEASGMMVCFDEETGAPVHNCPLN